LSTQSTQSRSYVHGASHVPLFGATIGEAFDDTVRRWPDRDALIIRHQAIRWTWAAFRERVDALAAGLIGLGLAHGDRVGIWSPNCAEWVLAQFATAKAGLVLVNINPSYRVVELKHALVKSGCRALITAVRFKTSDYLGMLLHLAPTLEQSAPGDLHSWALPDLRLVITIGRDRLPGTLAFDEVLDTGRGTDPALLAGRQASLQFDEAINIQFTSGTTGAPKGATLTHHNILNNGYFIGEAMRLTEADRMCIPVPLYHCFGMVLSVLACVTHGSTMVFPGDAFDPLAVMQAVHDERCTALNGVPTMFIAELQHPKFASFDFSSLRTGIMAGSPCPIEIMKRVVAEMHMHQVTICYGMTETSPVSFQSDCEDPLERRVSTVGRIHPHVEVKIVDDRGRIVPRGVTGELCTRGYSVMLGYWGEPEKTAEVVDDAGWMHTGDLATIDEEGYCKVVGRLKDMVIRGGENIYPREVEEFLFTHPDVADVQVVGVPDPKYGEELCAWIVLKPGVGGTTTEDIRTYCQGRIARFKVPKYVKFVDGFPMTVTGKVQKFLIREEMARELGVSEHETG
jgi:fatty-acyl-CoA synthase